MGDTAVQYFPMSYTVANWGNFTVSAVEKPIEFKNFQDQYSSDKDLDVAQVRKLMEDSFFEEGMCNFYNSVKFAIAVNCEKSEALGDW